MQGQLDLWPTSSKSIEQTEAWRQMDETCRKQIVGVLAKLIRRSALTPANNANEEEEHD